MRNIMRYDALSSDVCVIPAISECRVMSILSMLVISEVYAGVMFV